MPATFGDRAFNLVVAIPLAYVAYLSYRQLYGKPKKKRRKMKQKFASKKRVSSKKVALGRVSSRALRFARATTIPMRMFKDRNSKTLKLKAEDWVAEQRKLKSLAGKVK